MLVKVVGAINWLKIFLSVALWIAAVYFLIIFILRRFINFLSDEDAWNGAGWLYAILGFGLASTLQSLCIHMYFKGAIRSGLMARCALYHSIYKKSIRLANVSTVGEIVNLQSNDTQRVLECFRYIHFLYIAAIVMIISTVFLVIEIGPAASFSGFGVLLLNVPIQSFLGSLITKIRSITVPFTDERIRVMNEVLGSIKLVKLYSWERKFAEYIRNIRAKEVSGIRDALIVKGLNFTYALWTSPLVVFVAFSVYTTLGNKLDASIAFTAMTLFGVLKFPLSILPQAVKGLAEMKVSLGRISNFLFLPEVDDKRTVNQNSKKKEIIIKNAVFQYNEKLLTHKEQKEKEKKEKKERKTIRKIEKRASKKLGKPVKLDYSQKEESSQEEPFAMRDINLHVKKGELVAIVGTVGHGKSTLLQGIIGQVPLKSGEVIVNGSLCYVPQQAWLLNESLKQNILFGKKYKEDRYHQTIESCQLLTDIELLSAGDETEIGEKGVNLSGGQKQRISLARAVYANRDIYLLDDTLSAVDQYVGNAIFNQVIKGALKGKTILFVTNQLQYLNQCDKIVYLQDGRIQEQGTYEELMSSNGDFKKMMSEHAGKNNQHNEKKEMKPKPRTKSTVEILKGASKDGQLISQEDRSTGLIGFGVFKKYISAGTVTLFLLSITLFVVSQVAGVFSDWFFSYYIEQTNKPDNERSNNSFISIWWCILGSYGILLLLRYTLFSIFTLKAATELHNKAFKNVLRAPMRFFDSTPLGRILNRFTKDQDNIDDLLNESSHQMLNAYLVVLSTLILIITFLWWFAIAIIPILIVFWLLGSLYRKSSREMKRLEGITRSPIFAHLSATVNGLAAIKAFSSEKGFVKKDVSLINVNTSTMWHFEMISRWLALRLDLISTLITVLAAVIAVVMKGKVEVASAALALNYAIQSTGLFQWGLRMMSDTESHFTSVERIMYYSDKVEQEAPAIIEDNRPPEDWPKHPSIEYKNVEIRYTPDADPALRSVSFKVKEYEKVGIIGRTGSGKSTTASSIFRIIEPSKGKILIDGVNILKIGLEDLRSKLAIVPQDPVIFQATIRYNLDPFGNHTDIEIWDALEKVYLKKLIESFPQKLDTVLRENGENFSIGQRQLLCIGRAVLRNAKILVLDEATASIDMETDELVQKTIRKCFNNCTVLTIAHRLHTIIDSDKILFLDKGRVVEFDNPKALLSNPNSEFSKLVDETGEAMSKYLRDIAFGHKDIYNSPPSSVMNTRKKTRKSQS